MRQDDFDFPALAGALGQQVVGQPLGRVAQFVILDRTHEAAIATGEFFRDGKAEFRIFFHRAAQRLAWHHEYLGPLQRYGSHQRVCIENDSSQNEGRHGPQDGERGIFRFPPRAQFDRAFQKDVEEIDRVALHQKGRARRELLQKSASDRLVERRVRRGAEKRQMTDMFRISWS